MLKIVGDINFTDGFFDIGFGVGSAITNSENPFQHLDLKKNDLWLGNFECVCSAHSDKQSIFKKQFIINPQVLSQIPHMDIYGVANNHVMQHGKVAYEETLQCIEKMGAAYVGADTRRSYCTFHQNKKIGIIAFSQRTENYSNDPAYWLFPEYHDIAEEYCDIENCDFKIAYVHWGNEFIFYPYMDQIRFAHWLIDLGIDLVVGMHPHVLQGYEVYKNKYIFYSLGNFVFNMPWVPTQYGAILNVDLSGDIPCITYDYIHIGKDYFPKVINENKVPVDLRFEHLNLKLKNTPENEIYYSSVRHNMKRYRKANYTKVFSDLFHFRFSDLLSILRDFVTRKLS